MEANSLETFKLLMESVTTQRFEAGPAAVETKLEEGLKAIRDLQEEISAFKRRAADLNSAENLFSIPISPFPVLERLEQDVIELQKVYALYADHDSLVKEWAGQLWANVDFQAYRNVENLITSFRSELPLIERLKNEAIRPQHWKELMGVAGKVFDADNRNFRLQDVLNLRLSQFPEAVNEIIQAANVQRKWMYLDGIFTESIDIRLQLPEEAKKFDTINRRFLTVMKQTSENPNVLSAFCLENRLGEMKGLAADLDSCQRSLSDYLDAKRIMYPRFYFISDDELLSVLGSTGPEAVQPLMLKLFDNCKLLQVDASGQVSGMESEEGESYRFSEAVVPEGPAEEWMTFVDEAMKSSLYGIAKDGVFLYGCKPRTQWVTEQLGMVTCVATRIWWTWRVEDAFDRMEKGEKNALREEAGVQRQQASRFSLFKLLRESVGPVFGLQVAATLIGKASYAFTGTPLLVTLKYASAMEDSGGAPAGPAGTGKTETVKDLAKSLATRCVVQNCGEGLDYKAMGTIFSGLVQTGTTIALRLAHLQSYFGQSLEHADSQNLQLSKSDTNCRFVEHQVSGVASTNSTASTQRSYQSCQYK
ncbi:hypothetical protein Emag_000819 [Eimeria magna]